MTGPLTLQLPDELLDDIARRAAQLVAERTPIGPEPWVEVDAAARHLGYPDAKRGRQRIYDLIRQRSGAANPIPHRRDGRRLLFKLSELDKWVERGGVQG